MGNKPGYDSELKIKKSNSLGLVIAGGLIGVCGIGGFIMNQASLNNADLTNKTARNLSAEVLQEDGTFSRERSLNFLKSIGYQGRLSEDQAVYFRPVVDGFWSSQVQVVIAPQTTQDNERVREGNLLFDAYTGNPAGEVVASFTRDELAKKGYSF